MWALQGYEANSNENFSREIGSNLKITKIKRIYENFDFT